MKSSQEIRRRRKSSYQVAAMKEPLRAVLGNDAVRIVEQNDAVKMEADKQQRDSSRSTDFAAEAICEASCRRLRPQIQLDSFVEPHDSLWLLALLRHFTRHHDWR
jgi:hypothetical protein